MAISDMDMAQLNAGQLGVLVEADQEWADANARGDEKGKQDAHIKAQNVRIEAGYQGAADGTYDGKGSSPALDAKARQNAAQNVNPGQQVVNIGRVSHVNTAPLASRLEQQKDLAAQQAKAQADYAVETGIRELERAQEDAAPKYQSMRDQIDIDEARAKDNQVLYSEARGDRGGIGAAQYSSIQNTAAQNRVRVNQEQTKLATDTARAIADLRAQGEFQKADAILQLTQNYLSQLNQLEQWAMSTNVSIDQFNIGVDQWFENFQMQAANITGEYKGQKTMAAQQVDYEKDQAKKQEMANVAKQLIAAGMESSLTDDMYRALGFTDAQIANGTAKALAGYAISEQNKAEAQTRVQNLIKSGVAISDIPQTELDAAGYKEWEVKALRSSYAKEKVSGLLSSGMTPSRIPKDLLTDADYEQWEIDAMMMAPAQKRVLDDLSMGMSLSEIPKEVLDATGWSQAELQSYYKSAQAALKPKATGGSSKSSSSSSSSSSGTNPTKHSADYKDVKGVAATISSPEAAQTYLQNAINQGRIREDEAYAIFSDCFPEYNAQDAGTMSATDALDLLKKYPTVQEKHDAVDYWVSEGLLSKTKAIQIKGMLGGR